MLFTLQNGSNMIRIDNTQDVYGLQIMLNLIALNEAKIWSKKSESIAQNHVSVSFNTDIEFWNL